ncbi:MAG TPA: hypothetical protein VFM76_05855 [Methylophaga sp.]|nr:hypothetical protein [Methylophaga sp.]
MQIIRNILIGSAALMMSFATMAEPTQIMVRAKAVDSKFIGSSVGGVRVIIEDAETGEILDQGWINGDTGDTTVLIENPLKRGERQTDDTTAGYLATVDIDAPRLLRFKLIGPYAERQSMQESTMTSWVIPGKDILGDGIIIKMSGFIVDGWTRVIQGGQVDILTKATLLCGCPITKDGHWQGDNYEAKAIIMKDGKKLEEVSLELKGPDGMFNGQTRITEPGYYKAIIYLFDKNTGNVGVDRTIFEIVEPK